MQCKNTKDFILLHPYPLLYNNLQENIYFYD